MKVLNYLRARIRKFLFEEIWLEDYVRLGMKIGYNCSIQPGVVFDYSHCWLIKIGNNVTIAPNAYLLAHDASTKRLNGFTKVGSINIKDNVFIGARAIIMPGVTIGENSIVAAGSIVTKSVPDGCVVGGNPAKFITDTKSYKERNEGLLSSSYIYDSKYTLKGNVPKIYKQQMFTDLIDNVGYVE